MKKRGNPFVVFVAAAAAAAASESIAKSRIMRLI
jgi:hypothetical protein